MHFDCSYKRKLPNPTEPHALTVMLIGLGATDNAGPGPTNCTRGLGSREPVRVEVNSIEEFGAFGA